MNAYRRTLLERESIDLGNAADIELWTDALDIYTADLVHAVAAVGQSAERVVEYLEASGLAGRRSRTTGHDSEPHAP